jgi:flagellar motor component MotA
MKIKTELNEKETFTMTRDEFITEYHSVSAGALQLSKKARREGLLALEEMINHEKVKQRDILEFGLRFVVDGTDASVIRDILESIIDQEDDKYARKLMIIKEETVLSVQAGDNTRILAYKLNSFTSLSLEDDPIMREIMKEDDENTLPSGGGALSSDEIDTLLGIK